MSLVTATTQIKVSSAVAHTIPTYLSVKLWKKRLTVCRWCARYAYENCRGDLRHHVRDETHYASLVGNARFQHYWRDLGWFRSYRDYYNPLTADSEPENSLRCEIEVLGLQNNGIISGSKLRI